MSYCRVGDGDYQWRRHDCEAGRWHTQEDFPRQHPISQVRHLDEVRQLLSHPGKTPALGETAP